LFWDLEKIVPVLNGFLVS